MIPTNKTDPSPNYPDLIRKPIKLYSWMFCETEVFKYVVFVVVVVVLKTPSCPHLFPLSALHKLASSGCETPRNRKHLRVLFLLTGYHHATMYREKIIIIKAPGLPRDNPRLPGKRVSQSQCSPHLRLAPPPSRPLRPLTHEVESSFRLFSPPQQGAQCGCALHPDWPSARLKRAQAPSSVTKGGSPARAPAACCVSGGRRGPTTPCPTAGPAAMPTISSYRRRFPNCAGEACRWPAWQTPSPTARPTGR